MREAPGTRFRIERARTSWKVTPLNSGVSNVRVVTASAPNSAVSAARAWSESVRFSQRIAASSAVLAATIEHLFP